MAITPSHDATRRAGEMFPAAGFCVLATLVIDASPARGPPDNHAIAGPVRAAGIANMPYILAPGRVTLSDR